MRDEYDYLCTYFYLPSPIIQLMNKDEESKQQDNSA